MLIEILLLILAIPTGFLIAWLCCDELLTGRKWFLIIMLFGILCGLIFYFNGQRAISLTSFFIVIVSLVSFLESYNKKWTKSALLS